MAEAKSNRRDFIKKVGVMAGVAVTLPVVASLTSCEKDEDPIIPSSDGTIIKLSDYPALLAVGGSVSISLADAPNPVIIVRNSETDFLIADSVCKHQGCQVAAPTSETGDLICPCHGAVYSRTDASVVQKPSDNTDISGLTTYPYEYDAEKQELDIDFSMVA